MNIDKTCHWQKRLLVFIDKQDYFYLYNIIFMDKNKYKGRVKKVNKGQFPLSMAKWPKNQF